MGQLRVEKVQELMKQEISKIILQELKDPRIGFVTVTSVEATGDLREAKIYVSLMGNEQQVADCWQGLQSALGYIRREIGKRIRLRFTPELSFQIDKSLDYSDHIQRLLLQIQADDKAKQAAQEAAAGDMAGSDAAGDMASGDAASGDAAGDGTDDAGSAVTDSAAAEKRGE